MNEGESLLYLEEDEAALIISPDGAYQLILPDDEENVAAMVIHTLMKVCQHEELMAYVLKWTEEDKEFNLGDAEEVWH